MSIIIKTPTTAQCMDTYIILDGSYSQKNAAMFFSGLFNSIVRNKNVYIYVFGATSTDLMYDCYKNKWLLLNEFLILLKMMENNHIKCISKLLLENKNNNNIVNEKGERHTSILQTGLTTTQKQNKEPFYYNKEFDIFFQYSDIKKKAQLIASPFPYMNTYTFMIENALLTLPKSKQCAMYIISDGVFSDDNFEYILENNKEAVECISVFRLLFSPHTEENTLNKLPAVVLKLLEKTLHFIEFSSMKMKSDNIEYLEHIISMDCQKSADKNIKDSTRYKEWSVPNSLTIREVSISILEHNILEEIVVDLWTIITINPYVFINNKSIYYLLFSACFEILKQDNDQSHVINTGLFSLLSNHLEELVISDDNKAYPIGKLMSESIPSSIISIKCCLTYNCTDAYKPILNTVKGASVYSNIKFLECGHVLCLDCHDGCFSAYSRGEIISLNKHQCPICRTLVLPDESLPYAKELTILLNDNTLNNEVYGFCMDCNILCYKGDKRCGAADSDNETVHCSAHDPSLLILPKIICCPNCESKFEHRGGCSLMRCCIHGYHGCGNDDGEECDHGNIDLDNPVFCGHTFMIEDDQRDSF